MWYCILDAISLIDGELLRDNTSNTSDESGYTWPSGGAPRAAFLMDALGLLGGAGSLISLIPNIRFVSTGEAGRSSDTISISSWKIGFASVWYGGVWKQFEHGGTAVTNVLIAPGASFYPTGFRSTSTSKSNETGTISFLDRSITCENRGRATYIIFTY